MTVRTTCTKLSRIEQASNYARYDAVDIFHLSRTVFNRVNMKSGKHLNWQARVKTFEQRKLL